MTKDNQQTRNKCPRCSSNKDAVNVHGHYQCPDCKCVTDDCCQGECEVGLANGGGNTNPE